MAICRKRERQERINGTPTNLVVWFGYTIVWVVMDTDPALQQLWHHG
ncbi:MAG: hypothetical protein AAGU32_07280 [Bacillota bacterium]